MNEGHSCNCFLIFSFSLSISISFPFSLPILIFVAISSHLTTPSYIPRYTAPYAPALRHRDVNTTRVFLWFIYFDISIFTLVFVSIFGFHFHSCFYFCPGLHSWVLDPPWNLMRERMRILRKGWSARTWWTGRTAWVCRSGAASVLVVGLILLFQWWADLGVRSATFAMVVSVGCWILGWVHRHAYTKSYISTTPFAPFYFFTSFI